MAVGKRAIAIYLQTPLNVLSILGECSSIVANVIIRANFATSEGWNSTPTFNHRLAPLCTTPKGVNTRSKRTIEPK